MGLFSKFQRENADRGGRKIDISKTHTAKVIEVKNTIEKNANKVEQLVVMSEKYPQICEELKDILIEIKYANPVVDSEIERIDLELSNKFDDLKLMLSKSTIRSDLAVSHALRDIKELIQERESRE